MRRERRRKSEKTTPEGESKENKITRGKERTRNEKALTMREEHLRKSIKSGEGDGRDNEGRTKNEIKKKMLTDKHYLFIAVFFIVCGPRVHLAPQCIPKQTTSERQNRSTLNNMAEQ